MEKYTEQDLASLLKSVEAAFNQEVSLAKSEKEESKDKSKKVAAEDKEPKKEKEEEKHAEAHESEEAAEHKEEAEEKHAEHEGKERQEHEDDEEKMDNEHEDAAKPAEGHEDEGHDYDEHDMEHMHKMYMSMSKGELKAHHDACRMALDKCGMAKCGDMQMMEKSEASLAPLSKANEEIQLLKSENEAQKAKYEELKKSMDLATELLTNLVKKAQPQGKAITSLEVIAKSEAKKSVEEMSKDEVKSILRKKSEEDKSLTKSDRDAINAFWLGETSINKISHLLK